jgi:hypothetical protein
MPIPARSERTYEKPSNILVSRSICGNLLPEFCRQLQFVKGVNPPQPSFISDGSRSAVPIKSVTGDWNPHLAGRPHPGEHVRRRLWRLLSRDPDISAAYHDQGTRTGNGRDSLAAAAGTYRDGKPPRTGPTRADRLDVHRAAIIRPSSSARQEPQRDNKMKSRFLSGLPPASAAMNRQGAEDP